MRVKNLRELRFCLAADEIMNEQVFPHGMVNRILFPSAIRKWLRAYRIADYVSYKTRRNLMFLPLYLYWRPRLHRLSKKAHFDIPIGVLGFGVRIGHLSTLVMNGATKIGNYCCVQNNVVIADGAPKSIGNNCFIASNVVIAKHVTIADGCKISACSLVNKDCLTKNILLGGVVAKPIKECLPWTEDEPYKDEYERCEKLRKKMKVYL